MFKFLSHFLKTSSQTLTLKDQNEFVTYRRVFPKDNLKLKGSIFIYPPTGGENIIDRLYAKDLASLGFEVFILQDWSGNKIEGYKYELHNIFYGSAQNALVKVSKTALTKKFGVLGTSVGALHAAITLTTKAEFKIGFLIVGGLPIPEIIVSSGQPAMQDLKALRYREYKLNSDTQYLSELSQVFQFEPTLVKIDSTNRPKTGMIVSTNDELVPYSNQKMALDFFKSDPVYTTGFGHRNAIAWYGLFKRSKVNEFFKKTFN